MYSLRNAPLASAGHRPWPLPSSWSWLQLSLACLTLRPRVNLNPAVVNSTLWTLSGTNHARYTTSASSPAPPHRSTKRARFPPKSMAASKPTSLWLSEPSAQNARSSMTKAPMTQHAAASKTASEDFVHLVTSSTIKAKSKASAKSDKHPASAKSNAKTSLAKRVQPARKGTNAKPDPQPQPQPNNAPKPFSHQENKMVVTESVGLLKNGNPTKALEQLSGLPSPLHLPPSLLSLLSRGLASCPPPSQNPHPDWDRVVELIFNPMLQPLTSQSRPSVALTTEKSTDAWIALTTGLATALAHRGHARYAPLVDAWCSSLSRSSVLTTAAPPTSSLHGPVTNLLSQLILACATTGATSTLGSLSASIPDAFYTRELLRTLLSAWSTLRQTDQFRSTLLRGHRDLRLFPHPYIDESINVAYLASFTDPHAALATLRKMITQVGEHHGSPLGDYLAHAIMSPDLFATVLNLCREQDNRALVNDVLVLAETNHVPWTTAKARAAMMAFHCQVTDWPAAIDTFKGAWNPDYPFDMNMDMLTYAMVAFGGAKDEVMLKRTLAYALEAHRNKELVLSPGFMVRAFKALRSCFGWQVAANAARDMHAETGFLPDLVVSILQRVASEKEVTFDYLPKLSEDSYIHVQDKVGRLCVMGKVTEAEKYLDANVPRFPDNVEARVYMCMPVLAAYASVPDVVSMERVLDRHIADYQQCELAEDRQRIAGILFKGYALNNNFSRCLTLWHYLTNQGTAPHPSIQAMVLDACGYMNRVDYLDQIVRFLEHEPWGGCDINVWTSAVEAYCRLLRLDRAVDVATRIVPNKGLTPNQKFVCVLLTVRRDANRTFSSEAVAHYLEGLSPKLMAEVRRDLRERGVL